jgi:hypothetical protein
MYFVICREKSPKVKVKGEDILISVEKNSIQSSRENLVKLFEVSLKFSIFQC